MSKKRAVQIDLQFSNFIRFPAYLNAKVKDCQTELSILNRMELFESVETRTKRIYCRSSGQLQIRGLIILRKDF